MSSPYLSRITLYPVKSCGGIALERAEIGSRGLAVGGIGDRRWILADEAGQMITQRQNEALARVRLALRDGAVQLSGDGHAPARLDPAETTGQREAVMLFGREVVGHRAAASAEAWFSAFLGQPVCLLYQRDEDLRLCDPAFAVSPGVDAVGFADAYPYLLATEATLARLNEHLDEPVPMDRFRPNFVIAGTAPEAEYGWRRVAMGSAELSIVKPCTRCVVTTIDQTRGVKTGKEPLATLGRDYFLSARFGEALVQGAIFGENAIATRLGAIAAGEPVRVLEEKLPHVFRSAEASVSVTS